MSRGVGDLKNRRTAIELMRHGAGQVIIEKLLKDARKLDDLDQALTFIRAQHALPRSLYRAPKAYMTPNMFSPTTKRL
jgi:hypothetical protein